jgi:hypothetical protein
MSNAGVTRCVPWVGQAKPFRLPGCFGGASPWVAADAATQGYGRVPLQGTCRWGVWAARGAGFWRMRTQRGDTEVRAPVTRVVAPGDELCGSTRSGARTEPRPPRRGLLFRSALHRPRPRVLSSGCAAETGWETRPTGRRWRSGVATLGADGGQRERKKVSGTFCQKRFLTPCRCSITATNSPTTRRSCASFAESGMAA